MEQEPAMLDRTGPGLPAALRTRAAMTATLLFVQTLNGLQFGLILFLIAAGLTSCSGSWIS